MKPCRSRTASISNLPRRTFLWPDASAMAALGAVLVSLVFVIGEFCGLEISAFVGFGTSGKEMTDKSAAILSGSAGFTVLAILCQIMFSSSDNNRRFGIIALHLAKLGQGHLAITPTNQHHGLRALPQGLLVHQFPRTSHRAKRPLLPLQYLE